MANQKSALSKYTVIFVAGALIYMTIEMLWRGYTHWTMGILGGLILVLVGLINEIFDGIPLFYQSVIGSLIITALEYIAGYILNIKLGLGIWDYSNLPLNVNGQICLYFSLLWVVLGGVAVVIDDWIREKIYGEDHVTNKLF